MTRKTYCGNLLWQSGLTLLARCRVALSALVQEGGETVKSVFLAAFASLAAVLPAPLRAAEAPSAKPLLRVAVLSDIQGYPYAEDAGMRNLERALDVLAGFHPDVVVNAGDISDTGRDAAAVAYYKKRCDARLGPLPHIACMGNHELAFIPDELKTQRTVAAIRRDFNAVFGYPAGSRAVRRTIGGYDFVALSLSDCAGYTDDELAELKGLLDASVARDASKPIFVVTHYHPQNTVNDSASWWMGGGLRRLLDGYAQVVSLSGHTHAPLQDPRSIWQGGFTAIETSTLCYGCIFNDPPAANQVSSLLPYGHESVGFLLIEVFADRIAIRRFSACDRREIEPATPWSVKLPYRPEEAVYAPGARRACAPQFAGDPRPTLWYDYGFVYLMFDAASAGGPVMGYRIELAQKGGGVRSYLHLADFYRVAAHRSSRVVFRAPPESLKPGKTYHCAIRPVGFFGETGRAAEWFFTIDANYPIKDEPPLSVQE